MPVLSSTDFNYAGQNSTDLGLVLAQAVTTTPIGLPYQEPFMADISILETVLRGNPRPYHAGVQYNPITINMTFAFTNQLDDSTMRSVARLFNQTYYQPFYTLDQPDRIFYCMRTGNNNLFHDGLQGYFQVQLRCDSPYSYSPMYTSQTYDLSNNDPTNGTTIQFTNNGDIDLLPEIFITKVGNGDVTIVNNSNGGQTFKFTGLNDKEQIYVNNETEQIQSSLEPATYRYDSFNNTYLDLPYGINNLQVLGNCQLYFRYQFRTLQGAGTIV